MTYAVQVEPISMPELEGKYGPPHPIPTALEREIFAVSNLDGGQAVKLYIDNNPAFRQSQSPVASTPCIYDRGQHDRYWHTASTASNNFAYLAAAFGGVGGWQGIEAERGLFANPEEFSMTLPEEFSILAVVDFTAATGADMVLQNRDATGDYQGLLYKGAGGLLNSWFGAGTVNSGSFFSSTTNVAGGAYLVGLTFAPDRGVAIRVDAVEENRITRSPYENTTGRISVGSVSASNAFGGVLGTLLIYSVDMSRPERAQQLATIEAGLMDKFGL